MKSISTSFFFAILASVAFGQKVSAFEVSGSGLFSDFSNKIGTTDGRLSYDFGLGIAFPSKSARIEWLAGLRVVAYGTKSSLSDLKWGTQHNGTGGHDPNLPPGEDISRFEQKTSHFYLDAPVGLRYFLHLGGKASIFAQGTLGPTLYLTSHSQNTIEYTDGNSVNKLSTEPSDSYRNLGATGGLGLGIEMLLTNKLNLQLQPLAQMQFLSIATNSFTGAKWYAYGIRAGLRYSLNYHNSRF
jgi:hypothetical protein